ncbi:MAG: hypothetical protein H9W81_13460 [Enterococcus sp.]|nr:hypothetical protein [Enterococcus sp.]
MTANTNTEAIVRDVLGMTYDQFGFQDATDLIEKIVKVLDNEKNTVKDDPEDPKDASFAAEYIRSRLWSRFSGGSASAGATTELFLTLNRENELGWVRDEAHYPDYMAANLPARLQKAREAKQNS